MRIIDLSPRDFNVEHLKPQTQEKVIKLLLAHATAFSKSYRTLGKTTAITPQLNLQHNFPIKTKPYKPYSTL